MSVDREYKTHIAGSRSPAAERSKMAGVDLPAKKPVDLGGQERPNLESAGPIREFEPLPGVDALSRATTDFPAPDRLEPLAPIQATIPANDADTPPFPKMAGRSENFTAPPGNGIDASGPDNVVTNASQAGAPANPGNQPVIDAHALAELVNQAGQLHQAFPSHNRSAAGQDAFEFLSLIRQLRESFSEFTQAHVTRQELHDELVSLRLLIESKK